VGVSVAGGELVMELEIVERQYEKIYQESQFQILRDGVPIIAFDTRSKAEAALAVLRLGENPSPEDWFFPRLEER
jgi:hypothetical protein